MEIDTMTKDGKIGTQCPATYGGHRCGLYDKHHGQHIAVYREGLLMSFNKGDD